MIRANFITMLSLIMFVGNLIFLLNFIGKDYDVLLSDIETAFSNENMVEQQSLNGKSSKSISLYNKVNGNDQLSSTDKLLSILWNDMVSSEREEAYSIVHQYLINFTNLLASGRWSKPGHWHLPMTYEHSCKIETLGTGWSRHHLCKDQLNANINKTCEFISFGISREYTFEKDLSDRYQCHGFANDPSVNYSTNIYKNITFQQVGAQMLKPNENQIMDASSNEPWWLVSVPLLKKALNIQHLSILKMDCEGCEYALGRDIVRDDPTFFDSIDQLAIEVHLAKTWLGDNETLYYYGILLKKLHDSGLRLHHVQRAKCAPEHTRTGCIADFLCPNSFLCHNYLFARIL